MAAYLDLVRGAVRATLFDSASTVAWFGTPVVRPLPRRLLPVFSPGMLREYVLVTLQDHLYSHFYTTGGPSPGFPHPDDARMSPGMPAFLQALSEANGGSGMLDAGWEARRVDGETVVAARYGIEVCLRVDDCVFPPGTAPAAGVPLRVRVPKESIGRLPGFYLAVSDAPWTEETWGRVVRVYWNVTADGGIRLMRAATRGLNDAGVPFHLKVLADPGRVIRCDAAVLYLRQGDYAPVRDILERIYHDLSASLGRGVPALTKPLAPGLGLAEDPGEGLSFGESRCQLLADGLIRAHEVGARSLEDRCAVVVEQFTRCGLQVEAPYLNPGSEDHYAFAAIPSPPARQAGTTPAVRYPHTPGFVEAADRIAHRLCADAVWSGGRCNWMGAMEDAGDVAYGALGPAFYSGTSGVAWFLAEALTATGDARTGATALGAIRHALSRVEDVPPQSRLGMFSGWAGIALAAARIGASLGREDLVDAAAALVHRLAAEDRASRACDIIGGRAGAVVALLALQPLVPDASVVEWCMQVGAELLAAADKSGDAWSWRMIGAPRQPNLTGFSHGTAGVAVALLEVFRISGDPRFRNAAESAFAYERRWFDAEARNWPDLRGRRARSRRTRHVLPCSTFWCHGAPGIALSRLRAYEIAGDARWKAEAITALDTTRTVTERWRESDGAGFSLCHGLAGNADVLLCAATELGDWPEGARAATAVAVAGIERYGASGLWPLGTEGQPPALMVGLAGVGYLYLRVADPTIPSVLLIGPEGLAVRTRGPRAGVSSEAQTEAPSRPPN